MKRFFAGLLCLLTMGACTERLYAQDRRRFDAAAQTE